MRKPQSTMTIGSFVRPIAPPFVWRLGVIEEIHADGQVKARAYVAPPLSYEGSAASYDPSELEVVPASKVKGALLIYEARARNAAQVAEQIRRALEAAAAASQQ